MKLAAMTLMIGMVLSGPVLAGQAMTKDEAKAEMARIGAQAKAAREKCKALKGTSRDVCRAEAKGTERIAKAELDMKLKDTPKARYDVRIARADMAYDVARERCAERIGKAKHHCTKEARAEYDRARAEARAERKAAEQRKAEILREQMQRARAPADPIRIERATGALATALI
jgi:hypothetical protein